jgi:hypothetical protein
MPSSLVLSSPAPDVYRAVLAYTAAVYPAHWSVGATEVILTRNTAGALGVDTTRTVTAVDVPQGFIDAEKYAQLREQWARKLANVGAVQTDGKWVVIGAGAMLPTNHNPTRRSDDEDEGEDVQGLANSSEFHSASTLQLFRLHFPPLGTRSPPRLSFVRSLYGPNGPVASLALADGRCVSLGQDGGVWAWDLERGTGACVAQASGRSEAGELVFDERRIACISGGRVVLRRFDI